MVNGVGGASGDQDTENTELMAIYTKENQGAEKVSHVEEWMNKVNKVLLHWLLYSLFYIRISFCPRRPTHSHMIWESLLIITCQSPSPFPHISEDVIPVFSSSTFSYLLSYRSNNMCGLILQQTLLEHQLLYQLTVPPNKLTLFLKRSHMGRVVFHSSRFPCWLIRGLQLIASNCTSRLLRHVS